MKNYIENENEGHEDSVLSDEQRSSLLAINAPTDLRGKVQRRVAGTHSSSSRRRAGFPQLAAAGLLGFLSFLGAQALIGELGGPRVAGLEVNNTSNTSNTEMSEGDKVRNFHLQGVALLSTSDRYLDTLGPVGQSPEVVLATYMHERGAKK